MKGIILSICSLLIIIGLSSCQYNNHEAEAKKKIEEQKLESHEPVTESITPSGNEEYDRVRREYKLFGKWKITNRLIEDSWIYEIYQKGDEYIGYIPRFDFKKEVLVKKGFNYYVKGNRSGEYYSIDDEKFMSLWDKDGTLYDAGYSAALQK